MWFIHIALLVSGFIHSSDAAYQLVQDYSGDAFYQGFQFFTEPDPTDGHVQFQSLQAANSTGLAGFIEVGNSSKAVFMGVDSKSVAPNGRGAIRVSSTQTFQHALVVADIQHMPGGICGTWPAFWMLGANWPSNGEIDIVEGVNSQLTNSMTLHTAKGVVISNGSDFSGDLVTANCDINAPNQPQNAGCSIGDTSNLTFGADFNNAGGGVFATEWTSQFIKIWFFPRGSFPNDIVNSQPNPSENWGTPNALFQGDFNLDDHFNNLQIIFDTTFCGQVSHISRINSHCANNVSKWAGQVWDQMGCSSLAPTCEEYVTNNPGDFQNAFWAINTLQVFQEDNSDLANSTTIAQRDPKNRKKRSSSDKIRIRSGGSTVPRLL